MSPYFGRLSDRHGRVLPCLVGLGAVRRRDRAAAVAGGVAAARAVVLVTGPSIGILWTPSMAMISDGADGVGIDQGYAVALINLAWSTGQTLGSAGGARLGQAYGDALPYLGLAAACALTLAALTRPRYSAALARRVSDDRVDEPRPVVARHRRVPEAVELDQRRARDRGGERAAVLDGEHAGRRSPWTTAVGTRSSPSRSRTGGRRRPRTGG